MCVPYDFRGPKNNRHCKSVINEPPPLDGTFLSVLFGTEIGTRVTQKLFTYTYFIIGSRWRNTLSSRVSPHTMRALHNDTRAFGT